MIRLVTRAAIAVAFTAVLSACETNVSAPKYPQLSYSHLPQIQLNVGRIEVVREYIPPRVDPNVDHLFPVKMDDAAERWARDRLRPVGVDGVAKVIVRRASVVEVPLKQSGGVRGALTTEQSERYDAHLDIAIEVEGGPGQGSASVSSEARRSRTVPEDITLNQREKVWFEMSEAMMNDVNVSLETQIRKHLGRFTR